MPVSKISILVFALESLVDKIDSNELSPDFCPGMSSPFCRICHPKDHNTFLCPYHNARKLVKELKRVAVDELAGQEQSVVKETLDCWIPIQFYPKNGELVILLVHNLAELDHSIQPTEDEAFFRTIGMNNFLNDQDDTWHMAGWCWEHDHFTVSGGQPTHYQPMPTRPKP